MKIVGLDHDLQPGWPGLREHVVPPEVLVPVLKEFLAAETTSRTASEEKR